MQATIAAYVYPGWHACPERDRHFPAGWSEWDLVYGAQPRFDGHRQPNVPAGGRYDDSRPETAARQVALAQAHGIDVFVYGTFWSRGKRVFQEALDDGFLRASEARVFPFALMWANRMPRRVLPIKRAVEPLIDPGRLVHTDPDDFLAFIKHAAERYFSQPNYFRRGGVPYLSLFDTSFFLRQLGLVDAARAVRAAKKWLREEGFGGLHLAAIDPAERFCSALREVGFDSVTHYVWLPDWKGPERQDFRACAELRVQQWSSMSARTGLPYCPSVSPGWDATPRAADYGTPKPRRYPWSPVVIGSQPDEFGRLVARARSFAAGDPEPLVLVASWNEWSEGHYLEPDERFGHGWLEAIGGSRS